MRRPFMVDLRNIYPVEEVRRFDFAYVSVGRRNYLGSDLDAWTASAKLQPVES